MWRIVQCIDMLLVALFIFLVRWTHIIPVDLFQNQQGIRLVMYTGAWFRLFAFIVPCQCLQRPILRRSTGGIEFFQTLSQVVDEPQIRTRIARWVNRLVSPLYEALRIREASLFFR